MTDISTYPSKGTPERRADAILHFLGLGLSIIGAGMLIAMSIGQVGVALLIGVAIYATALVGSFLASALYHLVPWHDLRPRLRQIDQAAIYLKIAGTYTPFVLLVGSVFAYLVLALVWTLAMLGAFAKLYLNSRHGRLMPALYLALGWFSLALIWSLLPVLPGMAILLIGVGGLLYTIGVCLFYWGNLRFSAAIWHGHVLAASGCFFAAITIGVSGVG